MPAAVSPPRRHLCGAQTVIVHSVFPPPAGSTCLASLIARTTSPSLSGAALPCVPPSSRQRRRRRPTVCDVSARVFPPASLLRPSSQGLANKLPYRKRVDRTVERSPTPSSISSALADGTSLVELPDDGVGEEEGNEIKEDDEASTVTDEESSEGEGEEEVAVGETNELGEAMEMEAEEGGDADRVQREPPVEGAELDPLESDTEDGAGPGVSPPSRQHSSASDGCVVEVGAESSSSDEHSPSHPPPAQSAGAAASPGASSSGTHAAGDETEPMVLDGSALGLGGADAGVDVGDEGGLEGESEGGDVGEQDGDERVVDLGRDALGRQRRGKARPLSPLKDADKPLGTPGPRAYGG